MCRQIIWAALLLPSILWGVSFAEAGLPLIQIHHGDEDYPEMREEVRLEDFFWTGSGDGPPDYLKKVHTGISKGKEVIVKTETMLATVYVDGNNELDIPICVDCNPGLNGGGIWGLEGNAVGGFGAAGLPMNYSATDRRYWLLTVMSGFYTQNDNPMLEQKLARLYRLAFTRQQSRHLGINGAQQIFEIANQFELSDHKSPAVETSTFKHFASEVEGLNLATESTNQLTAFLGGPPINKNSELASSSEEADVFSDTTTTETSTTSSSEQVTTELFGYETVRPWEFIQENNAPEKQTRTSLQYRLLRYQPVATGDQVRVIIHNITQITEDDMQSGVAFSGYDGDVNEKIDDRPIANQTEVIYTVFVNGLPVLATTAANDMKLVSEREVSEMMGKDIFLKAEPYLREPQATPLAPATRSGAVGFLDSIQNNPALVVVSSLAFLLLLLLLLALLLMGRVRHRGNMSQVKRTSSRNDLLAENQSTRPTSTGSMLDTERSTVQSRDVGIQNFTFEYEHSDRRSHRAPQLHFPGPPKSTSRRGSVTSSENTSDSSIYCPLNPPTTDVQRTLDEKAATLFDQHQRRHRSDQHQYDRVENAIYTSVAREKKREKGRHKAKRRYENRVGSLGTSPVQRHQQSSSGEDVVTDLHDADGLRPEYQNFEHVEAFNHYNNYHRNLLLQQQRQTIHGDRSQKVPGAKDGRHSTKTTSRKITKALQPAERSSDTGSIGSFLSMASVKAFPKSTLPEPLNRVLEPVFVTYYDNAEESMSAAVKPSKRSRKKSSTIDPLDATLATGLPTPKAPFKVTKAISLSDNPDPGVVGPVVWERHKRALSEDLGNDDSRIVSMASKLNPVRDPVATRNHYEDLLEGAIQMYTSQDDLPMPLPTCDFNSSRIQTQRENRGASAGVPSRPTSSRHQDVRPATAQPEKRPKSNHSTQPPSPTSGAWGGSIHGSHSPLVRPMSAGPFHRPELGSYASDASKVTASRDQLSAAPIIEAIQDELRKFKQTEN